MGLLRIYFNDTVVKKFRFSGSIDGNDLPSVAKADGVNLRSLYKSSAKLFRTDKSDETYTLKELVSYLVDFNFDNKTMFSADGYGEWTRGYINICVIDITPMFDALNSMVGFRTDYTDKMVEQYKLFSRSSDAVVYERNLNRCKTFTDFMMEQGYKIAYSFCSYFYVDSCNEPHLYCDMKEDSLSVWLSNSSVIQNYWIDDRANFNKEKAKQMVLDV